MIKVITAVFAAVLLFSVPVIAAEQLKFSWQNDATTDLDGFRLYRDGQTLDTDNIPATATTITVPRQTDKKNHTYHLVAVYGGTESGPSQTAIDVYSYTIQAVGQLTIEVIK